MIRYLLIISFSVLIATTAQSQLYLGAGPSFFVPTQQFADLNDKSIGINIHVENHYFCNLWWGVRVEYFDFDKIPSLPFDTTYIEEYIAISPNVKINLTETSLYGDNTCNGKLIPYLNIGAILSISSTNQPETDKFGIGGNFGVGLAYGFTFAKTCMMLDFYTTYNSANFLYKDEARYTINSLILGLNMSIKL